MVRKKVISVGSLVALCCNFATENQSRLMAFQVLTLNFLKMKKVFLMSILVSIPFFSSCQNTKNSSMKKKTLVAYFSCTGNTRQLARTLASVVDGDTYEIKPEVAYSSADLDWTNQQSRSTVEMKNPKSRPAIAGKLSNMADYDVVYVGYPIWWYVAPTIINTFLESYDFSGKTIIPFCTSGSSGIGDTDKYLKPSCSPKTNWRPGKRFLPNADKASLKAWVESLQL
jgi:flavodoxin